MSSEINNKFVKLSIEKSLRDLPALPGVVAKILEETSSPNSSAASVEKLLSSDQALASKVLRVVNSAYYGMSGQVTSLSQAIMILGMLQIRNLVLSVSAISAIKPKTDRQREMLKQFWLHSFGTAAATQIIAKDKRMKVDDVEALFLGGLLHDIGLLFLYSMFTQTYDQVVRYAEEHQIARTEAEEKLLGSTHSQIGCAMATQWNLPEPLVHMISLHEGPFSMDSDPTLFAVHIGDFLTKYLYDLDVKLPSANLDPIALNWLNYSEEQMTELRAATDKKIEEASSLFGLLQAA